MANARSHSDGCGQVHTRRRQLGIKVTGFNAPKPVSTFAECGLDSVLLTALIRAGCKEPTAIQAQAMPAALSGRDILVSPAQSNIPGRLATAIFDISILLGHLVGSDA